jgi:hypothetical protein
MTTTTKYILYIVYIALLATLLPHTAWAFGMFEPAGLLGAIVAWAAAISFEAAIFALTVRLAHRMSDKPKKLSGWALRKHRYINAYSGGLVFAIGVSVLANLAHSVQFGQALTIFGDASFLSVVYPLAFGGVLPIVSMLFAAVLSNEAPDDDAEAVPNPALDEAKATISQLRKQLREAEAGRIAAELARTNAETERTAAELRFGAVGDLAVRLFATEKRARILAAAQQWPTLPASAVAVIADASTSYVSEILKEEARV